MKFKYKKGDKVFVSDWGKQYSTVLNEGGDKLFSWNIEFNYDWVNNPDFHIDKIFTPKLTLKGKPYKNGDKILVSKTYSYKAYEYKIIDRIFHPVTEDGMYLLKSKEGCIIQINGEGLTTLNTTEQKELMKIVKDKTLIALCKQNLNKWSINDNLKEFPKELLKYLYDKNQNTQFGSIMTKSIIKYPYIPKEYTINNNDICLGWEQFYNGEGCNLQDKETISWSELKTRFPENRFQ